LDNLGVKNLFHVPCSGTTGTGEWTANTKKPPACGRVEYDFVAYKRWRQFHAIESLLAEASNCCAVAKPKVFRGYIQQMMLSFVLIITVDQR
jgi:hypothetical protein